MYKIGKLYKCSEFYLLSYISLDVAKQIHKNNEEQRHIHPRRPPRAIACDRTVSEAVNIVKESSIYIDSEILLIKPKEIFMIVDHSFEEESFNKQYFYGERHYYKILCRDKIGWVLWYNWTRFYEPTNRISLAYHSSY